MACVNKVLLIGNLTRDPELRYTPGGAAVGDFSIALNRKYTKKDSGEKVEEVSYIEVTAWGKTAELCAEYLKKGRQVHIEGRLQQERWEKDGQKRSKVKVIAEHVTFLGSKDGQGTPPAAPPAQESATSNDIPF